MSSKIKILTLILFVFMFFLTLSGCSPSTRYKVLSFFFDGVPDPDRVEETISMDWKKRGREGKDDRQRVGEHGPFAAKMCDGCHKRGSNELILPIEQLCLNCHNLQIERRMVHGPIVAGGCRICHEPHGSGQPYLLVSESEKFCFHCHNERAILKNPVHESLEIRCTDCHDAHASDNQYLLK